MVSCKFLFDDGESDEVFIDEWAASGGITINELIKMEREFLQAIVQRISTLELTVINNLPFLRIGRFT